MKQASAEVSLVQEKRLETEQSSGLVFLLVLRLFSAIKWYENELTCNTATKTAKACFGSWKSNPSVYTI